MVSVSDYVRMAAQAYYYYRERGSDGTINSGITPFTVPDWTVAAGVNWSTASGYSSQFTDRDSGFAATTFQNGDEYVVAFRGTDDWRSGEGDREQNLSFGPFGLGRQTQEAIDYVQHLIDAGVPLAQISFTGHSLGGGLAGIVAGYFGRPAAVFDPAPYENELMHLAGGASGYEDLYNANTRQYVDIYRVQGEVLGVLFDRDDYKSKSYVEIDLGDSDYQDTTGYLAPALLSSLSGLGAAAANALVGYAIAFGEPRQLHHISTMVLAVLGYEAQPGVVEAYQALKEQRDLLRRLIDDDLTGVTSYQADSEEQEDVHGPSHGNFERVLDLNVAFATDFGLSFKKTDDGAQDGGGNRVAMSLLKNDDIRDAVIDLGFITARKISEAILVADKTDPSTVAYTREALGLDPTIFGTDYNSIALNLSVLTSGQFAISNDETVKAKQQDMLDGALGDLRRAILLILPIVARPAFARVFNTATQANADAKFVFGSVGGAGADYKLQSGMGILIGGELTDTMTGASEADFLLSPSGDDDRLDGAGGNDVVIALDGKNAVTLGGAGRDMIINRTRNGTLYGDTIDGLYDAVTGHDADGNPITNKRKVEDSVENADAFEYFSDTTIMDAQHHDVLNFFGIPLTGGDQSASSIAFAASLRTGNAMVIGGVLGATALASAGLARAIGTTVWFDTFVPVIAYTQAKNADGSYDLVIHNVLGDLWARLTGVSSPGDTGVMRVKDFEMANASRAALLPEGASTLLSGFNSVFLTGKGDLGMVFRDNSPLQVFALLQPLVAGIPIVQSLFAVFNALAIADAAMWIGAAAGRLAKQLAWADGADPLVIDLDGDGIETIAQGDSSVYFDVDGDLFAEKTGWLKGDDGFLALDANGNGRIDDIAELFGNRAQGGYAELAGYDDNHDGRISAADTVWANLTVWQDRDRDGVTDAGELKSLDALGIVELSLAAQPLGVTTPQGAQLLASGSVTFAGGRVSTMFEAIFNSSDIETRYGGEGGHAAWQAGLTIDQKGFGTLTDLSVAMANDVALGELTMATAAAMRPPAGVAPTMKLLLAQAAPVIGAWGESLETTRELVAVKLGTDVGGKTVLTDRAIYVEDAGGGYWTLESGAAVLVQGQPAARATLEQVLAQGADWRLEQAWSPATRATDPEHREEAPYLVRVENGRAVVLDHGIANADGSWSLASDPATTYATRDVILALNHAGGTEWRVEAIGSNPLAALPVEAIGVRFTDGIAVDYTVQVTDRDGSFYVWARNLDRALELEAKTGDYREFNLRNYEVDFDHLDEVGSTDDSSYRVELLTPAQFHFATSLAGFDFHPEMLTAVANDATGHLAYSVNASGQASLSSDAYVSSIKPMIELLGVAMTQYVVVSRRFAVRLAVQGGLADFFPGVEYDAETDRYRATTDRELAPMFEAIFAGAPTANTDDAVLDYLTDWNEVLQQVYPDYVVEGEGGDLAGSVAAPRCRSPPGSRAVARCPAGSSSTARASRARRPSITTARSISK